VNEPSAIDGFDTAFIMAHVFGVDMENAGSHCHGKWQYLVDEVPGLIPCGAELGSKKTRLSGASARVLAERGGCPAITINNFGAGRGVYVSSMIPTEQSRIANTRLLLNIILYAAGEALNQDCVTDNPNTECAWFREAGYMVLINNSAAPQRSRVKAGGQEFCAELEALQTKFFKV
jgi:beta-D-galactosyl-(1->4)-L-rhamnose phosphorylase